ncbi:hypothetical protein FKN01_04150 [Streptomyces sp. 130]|uniref:JmjC domain-containing protein n=1 Tax=Streptomyces sp. 130 TaxID=2591006 RepID=UPI00117D448F|nr:cupin domain-containing protein [Streptomyces sp. 130]TRV80947.1 hypothetical protein FKN01_04150 [Streptomyces sp. 130]
MIVTDDAVEPVLGLSRTELTEAMGRRWFHRPGALPSAGACTWADLNRALQYGNLGPDQIRLVGGEVPVGDLFRVAVAGGGRAFHRIVPEAAHRALATGATLVIDQLDLIDPWADQIARALSGIFTARVQANLYASLRRAPGFGAHQDTHDVFVVQGSGKKHWTVGTGTGATDLTMCRGDVLYLPEGTRHDVATDAEGSLDITFAVPRPNLRELLAWALDGSRDARLLAPVDTGDTAARTAALTGQAEALTDAEVHSFVEERLHSGMAPSFVNLPYAGQGATEVPDAPVLFARRSFAAVLPDGADQHARVLECLSATEPMAVGELVSASGVDKALEVVCELAQRGLISLSER